MKKTPLITKFNLVRPTPKTGNIQFQMKKQYIILGLMLALIPCIFPLIIGGLINYKEGPVVSGGYLLLLYLLYLPISIIASVYNLILVILALTKRIKISISPFIALGLSLVQIIILVLYGIYIIRT